jgi:hypothetical protein
MDACPLLITSIVAVKPEDQGTFFQDFLGLSGYLCSIGGFYSNTALLRTRNAQNHNEAQRLGVSRPPPTRSTTVKTDAQLRQLGGSAARRVGPPPAEQVLCLLTYAQLYKASVERAFVYPLSIR